MKSSKPETKSPALNPKEKNTLLTKHRLDQILWEKNNDFDKFRANGWEYFLEVLPDLEKIV